MPANAPLVVLIHQFNGSDTSLALVWPELHLPPSRVVLPDGRFHSSEKGYGWYHKEDQSDILQSRHYLLKLVRRLGPERPVIFVGLSQGGVMSLITGLHCPNKVLAIICMSYLPNPSENLMDLKAATSVPILMVHGQTDGIIPVTLARRGEKALKAHGYHPVFKTFPMGHTMTQASLDSVRDFLAEVVPLSRDSLNRSPVGQSRTDAGLHR